MYIDQICDLAYIAGMDTIVPQLARTPVQLGNALRRFRGLRGLSQAKLASLTGLRQATVSQIENGSGATRLETIIGILAALDLELTVAPRTKGSSQDIEALF
jgi:HTH-type transcriptional regulator / antitoxin HipB